MDYPESNEFVIVKVSQILDYGVFVNLLEYNDAKGFVHISNVSSSWVKNIRNLVKINQVRVAKVLSIDEKKRQIDLSFAGISPQMEKQKMAEFKQVNREEKIIALLAKQEKKKFDDVWEEVAEPLLEEFGSLHKAFEKVSLGEDISKIIGEKWEVAVKEMVDKSFIISKKILKGKIKVQTLNDGGVNLIKDLFKEINSNKGVVTYYDGAGNYSISVEGLTFKEAEKNLNLIIEKAKKTAKKSNIDFEFTPQEK
jgi:translation initiation factor 2 subunit 1